MFHCTSLCLLVAACITLFAPPPSFAQHPGEHNRCPQCSCEDVRCIEVTEQRCRMVTETVPIKKTVYETIQIPHCSHSTTGHHGKGCPQCARHPRMKNVLIKKEIQCGERKETKCVVEEVVVLVPIHCPKCGFNARRSNIGSSKHLGGKATPAG
jgi:hypothetical protein